MKKIILSFCVLFPILFYFGCTNGEKDPLAKWDEAELVWSDEFESETVDTTKWRFETGGHGWGNREWQDYQPLEAGNVTVSEGILSITARKTGDGQKVGDYTSARMNSRQSFTYGRMEIRAKMPEYKGPGIWPALWMLGENMQEVGWPESGEIDIMEYVSWRPDSVLATIHTTANNHRDKTQVSSGFVPLPTIEEEFHNFGILLEEDVLHFYIDEIDNIILTFNRPEDYNQQNWPFDKPFYFIMNIAVAGNLGGVEGVDDSIFPATMEIDYVKVWQLDK